MLSQYPVVEIDLKPSLIKNRSTVNSGFCNLAICGVRCELCKCVQLFLIISKY